MNAEAYLARLGVDGLVDVSIEALEDLQRAHLTHIPFENLDVFHRRGVRTDTDWSLDKVVVRGRGGWCYELNGAFAWLLADLGFEVRQLGATVLLDGKVSPVPDHLTIEVTLDRPYLVDVGFGDSFIRPLPLDGEGPHDGGTGMYSFAFGEGMTTLRFDGPDGVEPQYRFGRRSFTSDQFEPASHRLQTEPGLRWTQSPFATRLLDGGPDRVTLLRDRIKVRRSGEWTEQPVPEDEWAATLLQWFDMTP
jgi:N-hydroxyarylamine O-acetyltransferase